MLKKILYGLLILTLLFLAYHYPSVIYGLGQAKGQIKVLYHAQDIEQLMEEGNMADSIKDKFIYIQEVKSFAQDSLGLSPSKNYTTFYDQKGKAILWVVTASPEFEIEAYEWKFPIAGKFSYKGYFDFKKAEKEAEELRKKGFDTDISEVSAWSTLGFFKDPILSSMLQRNEGSLAELIIHELTHATVYRRNQVQFNENFATFVGKEGAKRFMEYKFGKNAKEITTYFKSQDRQLFYREFMHRETTSLDSLYHTFEGDMSLEEKQQLKARQINKIKERLAHSIFYDNSEIGEKRVANFDINNAYLSGFKTYHEKQDIFSERLENEFKGDLKAFIKAIKEEK